MESLEDVMIDLETASTQGNATILTIGAIKFNRTGPTPPLEEMNTFYRKVIMLDQKNGHVDPSTIEWWSLQPREVYNECFGLEDRKSLNSVLKEFTEWFGDSKYVWSMGSDFDCVILGNAYQRHGQEKPWKYWNTRDVRTILDIRRVNLTKLRSTNLHHALHDCYRQIRGIHLALAFE